MARRAIVHVKISSPDNPAFNMEGDLYVMLTSEAPTLVNLSLVSGSAQAGVAGSSPFIGQTAGSTLTLTDTLGGVFSINMFGALAWTSAITVGTKHPVVRETLAGATNSPHDTTLDVVASAPPYSPRLDFRDKRNSMYIPLLLEDI